jgi:tetratricopeptide (TPR) repeat protein
LHFWDGIADGWRDLGYLARVQGDFDQAEKDFEESLAVSSRHGLHNSDILYHLGLLALIRDNYGLAHARFTHPLKLTPKTDERTRAGIFLIGLAAVAGGTIQPERAARLYGAGLAQLEASKQQISQVDQTEFARHIQMAREQLGEDRFETSASAGRAMLQEQAIDYALSQG